jgi:2-methylisocitrate lyase-like PEP mutase family enzyme
MTTRSDKVKRFRNLHRSGCFTIPNPWDVAGARMLAALGFPALATTSSGFTFSTGGEDIAVRRTLPLSTIARDGSRTAALRYAAAIAAATDVPVSMDSEDCYADTPDGVADTVRLAAEAGLAGLSIEDRQPNPAKPIRDFDDAVARVKAAVAAARKHDIVLTARADGLGPRAYDLDEAIRRLKAFEALGADVLYAPALPDLAAVQRVCRSVDAPVNHVIGLGAPGLSAAQIASAGVRRISLGGSLAKAMGYALLRTCQAIARGDFSDLERAGNWDALYNPTRIPAEKVDA